MDFKKIIAFTEHGDLGRYGYVLYACVIISILLGATVVYGQVDPISKEVIQKGMNETFNISPTTVYGVLCGVLFVIASACLYFLIQTNKNYIKELKEARDHSNLVVGNNTQAMEKLVEKIEDMGKDLTWIGALAKNILSKA